MQASPECSKAGITLTAALGLRPRGVNGGISYAISAAVSPPSLTTFNFQLPTFNFPLPSQFIQDILREVVEATLYHDSPKQLRKSAREALERRTAPYRWYAITIVTAFLASLIGVVIWLILTPEQPGPWGGTYIARFGFYMLSFTLGVGLLNLILSALIRRWRFCELHESCAYCLGMGSCGFSIALTLWGLFLSFLLMADV